MKSKPRILYLIGSRDPGGAEKVLIDLSVYFQSKDFIVTVGPYYPFRTIIFLTKRSFFLFANFYGL